MKRDNRKLISLIIMAILFSLKASGQTAEPNALLGCHLQPWQINVQGDSIAVITFVQSASLYILDLKEQKSKLKLDLLKKAKLEKKTTLHLC